MLFPQVKLEQHAARIHDKCLLVDESVDGSRDLDLDEHLTLDPPALLQCFGNTYKEHSCRSNDSDEEYDTDCMDTEHEYDPAHFGSELDATIQYDIDQLVEEGLFGSWICEHCNQPCEAELAADCELSRSFACSLDR